MKNFYSMLTMVSFICLCAFTPSKEMNHTTSAAVKKNRPTVTVSYPSEFTRLINYQLEKAIEKANAKSKNVGPYFAYTWWDFNGNYSEQTNPNYYSIDPDNWPECTTPSGNTYCEIRALASAYDSTIPDLGTINGTKYRPL